MSLHDRRHAHRLVATGGLLLPAAMATAGCGIAPFHRTEGMEIRSDPDLDRSTDEPRDTGRSVPLRDHTDFTWESVYRNDEGTPAERVNVEVGATVLRPGTYLLASGAPVVFATDGEVVQTLLIRELTFERSRHGADTVVERGHRLIDPPTEPRHTGDPGAGPWGGRR